MLLPSWLAVGGRVQMLFGFPTGVPYGGTVVNGLPEAADILIAFDDGELKSFPPEELLAEIKAQTLQELEPSRLGLVDSDDGHAMAADLTWVKARLGALRPPRGVVSGGRGDGDF